MIESQTTRSSRTAPPPATSAWRIRFVDQAPADARVLRRFLDPAPTLAIAESIPVGDLSSLPAEPDAVDELYVAQVPDTNASLERSIGVDWLGALGPTDGMIPVMIPLEDGRLYWRPGRALLEGNLKLPEQILTAIAEFAFYEGRLRKLEQDIRPFEATAQADAALSHQIREADRTHWPRLVRSAEQLALLRLNAARLEPRAFCPPRDLPAPLRRIIARLAARADIEDRLEALSARLEACEDLYEGAVDRITDHTWARKGNRLEIAIVALLLVEGILLLAELAINLLHGRL